MRNFIKKMVMMAVMALAMLFGFTAPAMAQMSKLSPATRMIIADRDGKISIEKANAFAKGHQTTKTQTLSVNKKASTEKTESEEIAREFEGILPFAEPFTVNGVKMAQCWINMTDNNYSAIEALGVKILAKFDGLVTANIPVKALEKVAALENVKKISVADKLQKNTYYARKATNVDDVLTWSSDAQAAGLLQAYDGTGVVVGIIDNGIQFNHQMFKDGNGNTRIKLAGCYDSTSGTIQWYDTQSGIEALTTIYTSTSHGTHTSSIAAGSDISVTGNYYDIEADEIVSNGTRTYGGMAPKADLVLCDMAGQLTNANVAECIQRITEYAASVGKPCVISMSFGSQYGPHDGTGNFSVALQQSGIGQAGKIAVKAASNAADSNIYHYAEASASSPAMTILDCTALNDYESGNYTFNNYFVYGGAITYARTPEIELAARAYVVDVTTNEVKWISNEITDDASLTIDTQGAFGGTLSTYVGNALGDNDPGSIRFSFDKNVNNNKYYIETEIYYLRMLEYSVSGSVVTGKYKIGVSYYPKDSSKTTFIDSWGLSNTYFEGADATASGNTYAFTSGNNLCSISDDSTSPYIISIGSYTSSSKWVSQANEEGYYYSLPDVEGDIADYSSYQKEGYGPLGNKLPWITAPGNMIIAGYNSGWVSNNSSSPYLIHGYDSSNPLAANSGTSMASPCAGGIVALWLQVDPTLTLEDVKNVMQVTAIRDNYTSGTNAAQFGNGKIDALAGIQYLLDQPAIKAEPEELDFNTSIQGDYQTLSFKVYGFLLTDDITVTLTDENGVFTVGSATVSKTQAMGDNGVDVSVTFRASTLGTYTGTITLTSTGATTATVILNATARDVGKASDEYLNVQRYETIDEAGWNTTYVNQLYKFTEYENQDVAWLTMPVYGAWVGATYATNSTTVGGGHPQAWIQTNVTSNNNTYASKTWSADYPYLGTTNTYFNGSSGNGAPRAMGINNSYNITQQQFVFWVTNVTEVNLLGMGRSGVSATYPAALTIYEGVETDEGLKYYTSARVTETSTSTSTSTPFKITSGELDASKIYRVVASVYRGYLYEIGFKTPLKKDPELTASPTELAFECEATRTDGPKSFTVNGINLSGNVTLTLNDENGVFTIDKQSITPTNKKINNQLVNVTFNPSSEGTYTGNVTLTADGLAIPVVVNLTGVATKYYPDYFDVSINSYGVGTLFVDFPLEIPYDTYDDLLGVYYVYDITDDCEIKLSRLKKYIPANEGVVVQGNQGTYRFPKATGVDPLPDHNYLSGTVTKTTVSKVLEENNSSGIVMTLGRGPAGYVGFYKYVGGNIPANRAFIIYEAPNANSVNSLSISGLGGEFTGIKDINARFDEGDWYTPQGVRLNGVPQQRGIYIHNGKTVVVR